MPVSVVVRLGNTTPEIVSSYLWAGVTVVGDVFGNSNGEYLMLNAEDLSTAEMQRDRLASGMIGARVVESPEQLIEFIS